MAIKAILFDKDGTLLDFNGTFAPATAKVLRELANGDEILARDMAEAVEFDIESHVIGPQSVLVAGSLENISQVLMPVANNRDFASFNARVDALYIKHSIESLKGFDILVPTLDSLKVMKLPMGIATNDSESGAHCHLGKLGVIDRFCFIAGYDSGHGEKPGPGMVLAYAEYLGLEPSQVAMVGDSVHDLLAGRAAGATAVAVTSGPAVADDLRAHADHVLADISALPGLVKQVNQ